VKAVLYEAPLKLSFGEVPDPAFEEDSILIRISYSYVCATDIKTYKQGHPHIKPHSILGHEFSGIVEKVGPGVTLVRAGDTVTAAPFVNCGVCEMCVRGRTEACPDRQFPSNGALAELLSMPEGYARKGLARIPAAMMKECGLAEPVACVLNSARAIGPRPGDSVLVVGAGFMGILNALVMKCLFGAVTCITDVNSKRLDLPASLGIRVLAAEELGKKTFNTVILTPPIVELIPQYEACVAPFGTLVLFGGYKSGATAQIDPNILHYKGVKLTGTSGFSPFDFQTAVKVITEGALPLSPFTREIYPFADFEKAFRDAAEGRALKVGFDFGAHHD
jgi:L-iditol 2-dehydrogenase